MPVAKYYLENAWPSSHGSRYGGIFHLQQPRHTVAAGKETHYYTITLQDATIAAIGQVTELLAQEPSRQAVSEEVAFHFGAIVWTYEKSARSEVVLRPRIGQKFRLLVDGRVRLEGTLKAARSTGPDGKDCEVLISGARRT